MTMPGIELRTEGNVIALDGAHIQGLSVPVPAAVTRFQGQVVVFLGELMAPETVKPADWFLRMPQLLGPQLAQGLT
jgi:hypothetical protein